MTTPAFPLVLATLDRVVLTAFEEDLGTAGDITSSTTVSANAMATAAVVARRRGAIAGLNVAARAFTLIDSSLEVDVLAADGDQVEQGSALLQVSGNARSILTGERTALNFLGHLSGVATETRKLVDAISHTKARICCTRKTTPGLRALEKYAVRCGGGFNHRFGLGDGLLIKDNHIVAADGIAAAVRNAKSKIGHMVKIEVEVDRLNQIEAALESGADVIMLDNMDLKTMVEAVALINDRAVVEASGSITIDTAAAVAETGVDVISVGWITHSAPCLDVGLDFKE
ncbi:MAG: carboxylating nicotinate-nucleotide diphosphorylase [Rhodospirillaceae bacterium]|jgi:nicotinate-nucleotide pyrophosphorylase (carboxylating)|nr:carboxylating nicotinate-nucleotide diphosphorylase [Rhodospirillaceae bacterium]MBT5565602.1 carboxylating nicotinate-nucleotide diphosphorylase [Rhodospirillaceae bacterium]MBT6088371.1 carboxylating nicotinate-nucleotide diphosphorylase [Rhodospirillaceae bacterium]MBT7450986.1 carboxylating nicotinate-nucleotide diphosphorylase [Rhodospirillaceae bacterium]